MFKKYHFKANPVKKKNRAVILVHGLFRRGYNFWHLGRALSQNGYESFVYDYPTRIKTLKEQADDLNKYIENISNKHNFENINFVTHSMGGIILRIALANIAENQNISPNSAKFADIKRVVMLAPPNRGSHVAEFFTKCIPVSTKLIKPLPELREDAESVIHSIPLMPSAVETGIIAAEYDLLVKENSTHLPYEKDFMKIKSDHSMIMYFKSSKKAILNFLEKASFK